MKCRFLPPLPTAEPRPPAGHKRPPKCAGFFILALLSLFHPSCRAPRSDSAARVLDDERGRRLVLGRRLRGYVDTTSWESRLRYVAVMNLPMRYFAGPGRMFLIGVGSGSIVKRYRRDQWSVEAAEPDSALTALIHRSFGLRDGEVNLHQADGRHFLDTHRDRYDIILEDLVGTPAVEPGLVTKEFFEEVDQHLEKGGIFAVSLETAGWQGEAVRTVAATLMDHFPYVLVLPIAEPPDRFGSIVIIASNSAHGELVREVDRNADLDPEWRFGQQYQETHAWDNRFIPLHEQTLVQTDAHNTLGRLFESIGDSAGNQPPDYLP